MNIGRNVLFSKNNKSKWSSNNANAKIYQYSYVSRRSPGKENAALSVSLLVLDALSYEC